MTSQADNKRFRTSEALRFWLEEYRVLASDIQNRVALQHGLMNFQILIMAAFIALFTGVMRAGDSSKYVESLKWCVLFSPLVFAFFNLRHSNHDINIIDKARYIHHVIRPNIARLTGNPHPLQFESFIQERRGKRSNHFGWLTIFGNEQFFSLAFSFITVLGAFYVFVGDGTNFGFARNFGEFVNFLLQDILVIGGILALAGITRLRIRVGRGYMTIASEN